MKQKRPFANIMFARILPKSRICPLLRKTSTNNVPNSSPKFDCPNCKKPNINWNGIVYDLTLTGLWVFAIWMVFGNDYNKELHNDLMHERDLHNQTKKMLKTCNETSELYRQLQKDNESKNDE